MSLAEDDSAQQQWFPFDFPDDEGRPTIVALPFAGGGASFYTRWRLGLPDGVGLSCPQPPGRENRLNEPALTSMGELVDGLADALEARLAGLRYVLFGHSLGAMMAFELAKELTDRGLPEPEQLIVSGANPPDMWPIKGDLHAGSPKGLADYLRSFDYVPEEVLASTDFMHYGIPLLRADLEVCCTYVLNSRRLSCPVSVFCGTDDAAVDVRKVSGWGAWTSGGCRTRFFPGGHFYLDSQMNLIRDHVVAALSGRDFPDVDSRRDIHIPS